MGGKRAHPLNPSLKLIKVSILSKVSRLEVGQD
jgi:hypothetical protein